MDLPYILSGHCISVSKGDPHSLQKTAPVIFVWLQFEHTIIPVSPQEKALVRASIFHYFAAFFADVVRLFYVLSL